MVTCPLSAGRIVRLRTRLRSSYSNTPPPVAGLPPTDPVTMKFTACPAGDGLVPDAIVVVAAGDTFATNASLEPTGPPNVLCNGGPAVGKSVAAVNPVT